MADEIPFHAFYKNWLRKFSKINSICNLTVHTQTFPFAVINFECCFPDWPATYKFCLINNNLSSDTDLVFTVDQTGTIMHNITFLKQLFKKVVLKNLSFEEKQTIRQ